MVNIQCAECGHIFELSETQIPSPTFKVKCPACKKVFQTTVPQNALWEQFKPEIEALLKVQLQAIRQDLMTSMTSMPGGHSSLPQAKTPGMFGVEKRSLVCESNPATAQKLVGILQHMGYFVQVCSSVSEALGRLESGFYDVITVDTAYSDDPEGGQKILNKVNSRKPDERRKMFLVVVSDAVKTVGPHAAFFQGANMFVQKSDLQNFENLLQEGIRYYSEIYGNFYELLQEKSAS